MANNRFNYTWCIQITITYIKGVSVMNEWLLRLIGMIVNVASPELRKVLEEWLTNLETQAKKTSNPWDDILVAMLKSLLLGK
ncbi:hypothetical protein ES705_38411 [subsurface metagenome]